ncbi:MAG: Rrf2 family transcriptional regulator [Sphingopyxis sp.]|nr:Rrf2 family transcriptional regulator [Sphingopyxis sp.]
MRLNLQTDYALRTLMMLAAQGSQISVDEIADAYGISRHHLMKVAGKLAELGYVVARRGRGGGLTLARPAQDINVGSVVRDIEAFDGFVECFDPKTSSCAVAGICGLQGALSLALGDFLTRLDGYSLADLVPNRQLFAARLARTPP